ncbi:cysteine dioxygenase [Mumia zhuanghuii]|uniref:Cysteine dioxygenase n=2 Tax=Mumia TaxID=1546255 RepID=A0ABW1QHS1_9ACTN|nr:MULTISPECIES: cysteine dioxygenase family protein [Mumia]KAA1418247.1 cysteine dioxygenase [Mumia zhuanghuii]
MTVSTLHPRSGRALTPAQLRTVVDRFAAEARAGVYTPTFDWDERWHVRIHADDDVEVWLISWTKEQGTELHDHGGSSGVFTVVEGALTEYVWAGSRHGSTGRLVDRVRRDGDTVSFGPRYVHDVRNHDDLPAVSVHAYSPPISLMNYYDTTGSTLVRRASSWTDDPEAPSPERISA